MHGFWVRVLFNVCCCNVTLFLLIIRRYMPYVYWIYEKYVIPSMFCLRYPTPLSDDMAVLKGGVGSVSETFKSLSPWAQAALIARADEKACYALLEVGRILGPCLNSLYHVELSKQ